MRSPTVIFIISLAGLCLVLSAILFSRSLEHVCEVQMDGARHLPILNAHEQHIVNIRSNCNHLRISGFGCSIPLNAHLVSHSLPTEIRLSAESEGIGFYGVSVTDRQGRLVYSASERIPVRSYPMLQPQLRQAVLYRKTILRLSLFANESVWKFVEPYTVRLWLFDNRWRLLNKDAVPVKSQSASRRLGASQRFFAYFSNNIWTFDFELPSLSTPPAYALVVGGGKRGLPDEFDFEAMVAWHEVANTKAAYSPLAAPIQSPSYDAPCRWRWWYKEQTLSKALPKAGGQISGDLLSVLSRRVGYVSDEKNPFHMATKGVATLLVWHETPHPCEPLVDCDINAEYSLCEQWNKGGIHFSKKEWDLIRGKGVKGTTSAPSPMEYQVFHKLIASLSTQSQPVKVLENVFAACSHPHLQRPFGIVSRPLLNELPATLPVQDAYIGSGYPLGTILGRANSDHNWSYQGRAWLSVHTETVRYYYFGIPPRSSLSRIVFEENNSVAIILLGRCRYGEEMIFSAN